MAGPLTGIRALELASFISGPYAGMLLADLGAEVIKVEPPGSGDPFRGWEDGQAGITSSFASYNRGKKSVTLNIRTEPGRDAYRRLSETVDVVVENFRPGTTDRLGIGYEVLRERNPRLVYCLMTGMGSSGPDRDLPSYDAIAQARGGLWSVLTDLNTPKPIGPAMADQLTGLYAAYGVLGALVARSLQGCGQKLEVSMLSAIMAFMTSPIASYLMDGEVGDQDSRPRRSQSYAFLAGDSLPLGIHLSSPPKFWEGLARAVGRLDLIDDPRFKTKGNRVSNYDALRDILADIFHTRPRAEWLAILREHDVPSAPINTVAEAVADPQARHIGMVRTFGTGNRTIELVGFPAAFAETPAQPGLPPPFLSEHTEQVLRHLGYSDGDIERLRREDVI